MGTYLRVGLEAGGAWRTFKVRQDFAAAAKIQTEDDISASVVVPADALRRGAGGQELLSRYQNSLRYKFIENCEFRLFQRPDEAIHRGMDKQTEADLARPDNFISNFEPLDLRAGAPARAAGGGVREVHPADAAAAAGGRRTRRGLRRILRRPALD